MVYVAFHANDYKIFVSICLILYILLCYRRWQVVVHNLRKMENVFLAVEVAFPKVLCRSEHILYSIAYRVSFLVLSPIAYIFI